ncbi:hypothetical protein ACFW04_008650 [Cataglyphis niger]
MLQCGVCGCTDFYIASGYSLGSTCQTQNQMKLDGHHGNCIIFVLIGLTNELIELSMSADIKIMVLQLWKLMITADYDRFMQSQMNSEGETLSTFNQSVYNMQSSTHMQHTRQSFENIRIQFDPYAKDETKRIKEMARKIPRHKCKKYKQNHVTTQYKTGPELITPMKLWTILYGREGHLSYYKLDRLIPIEVALTRNDVNFLSQAVDITHKGMRRIIGRMAKFLGVTTIICPDFLPLINRYCSELNLPRGISLYTERLVVLSLPKMKFDKKTCIPNYEGRAMAFIIVVLKTLLSLDGITEYEISNFADKINNVINEQGISDTKLFNFREWQRYIECRKAVLANAHYPIKLKYNLHIPDANSLYIKFLETIITHKHLILRELIHAMKQCITDISCIDLSIKMNEFSPSLMAHHSYLQQLLEHPLYDLPNITDYLHKKMTCRLKIDGKKRQYYDNIRNSVIKDLPLASSDEFIFNETLPNGKLAIPNTNDNENENNDDNDICYLKHIVPEETALLLSKFCKEYDINLSRTKKKKQKRKLFRNTRGKFVKENFKIENMLPNISDILSLSINASIFNDLMKNEIEYDADDQLENNCKKPIIDDTVFTFDDNALRLLRSFKDYWMYHCNFSRVKTKNFELFEEMLPRSFRWLLDECEDIIEMSAEDLYEEVCLVEAYYAYFSEQSNCAPNK